MNLVLLGAMQINMVTKSGRDGRIVCGEIILGAQLGTCVSGSESSALMLFEFLPIRLSILAKPAGDWVGRRLQPQGKGRWTVKVLPNPATRSHCFTGRQNRAVVKKSMVYLHFGVDLSQLVSCHSKNGSVKIFQNLVIGTKAARE
jgi:hypothetical protein